MSNRYLNDESIRILEHAFYHENENSLIYKQISSWLNLKGFVNLSKYFSDWATEELSHGEKVRELLISFDIPLVGGKIEVLTLNLDLSLAEFSNLSVIREDETTNIYKRLTELALDNLEDLGSSSLLEFALSFSKEQVEETDKALTLNRQIKNLSENWALAQLFDNMFNG